MITIRSAREEDLPRIRQLINKVRINPLGLDWSRFILAVTNEDELVGCGQIKPHKDGSQELASIAVDDAWRNQGIARCIIEQLIASHPGDLYLTCRSRLGEFYEKFGFKSISEDEMPSYFHRINRLARIFGRTGLIPLDLLVMKRIADSTQER